MTMAAVGAFEVVRWGVDSIRWIIDLIRSENAQEREADLGARIIIIEQKLRALDDMMSGAAAPSHDEVLARYNELIQALQGANVAERGLIVRWDNELGLFRVSRRVAAEAALEGQSGDEAVEIDGKGYVSPKPVGRKEERKATVLRDPNGEYGETGDAAVGLWMCAQIPLRPRPQSKASIRCASNALCGARMRLYRTSHWFAY